MTRVLDIADSARGEEAGEFQGRLLGASVSVIVVDAPPGAALIYTGTPTRRPCAAGRRRCERIISA
jgi:hypothetical protein